MTWTPFPDACRDSLHKQGSVLSRLHRPCGSGRRRHKQQFLPHAKLRLQPSILLWFRILCGRHLFGRIRPNHRDHRRHSLYHSSLSLCRLEASRRLLCPVPSDAWHPPSGDSIVVHHHPDTIQNTASSIHFLPCDHCLSSCLILLWSTKCFLLSSLYTLPFHFPFETPPACRFFLAGQNACILNRTPVY